MMPWSIFSRRSTKRYRYDAFISYSREDAASVDWLAKVLRRTWVPWRLPPRLFIDRTQLAAGGLGEVLERALADSRFLIVCCSDHTAARPHWINLEVDSFAHSRVPDVGHGSKAILACRVGTHGTGLPPAAGRGRRTFFAGRANWPGPAAARCLILPWESH